MRRKATGWQKNEKDECIPKIKHDLFLCIHKVNTFSVD